MKNSWLFSIIIAFSFLFFWGVGYEASHAASETGTVVVSTSLNVRTGPGTTYDKLQHNNADVKLSNGTKVTILEKKTGWYKVSFTYSSTNLTGYVSAEYVALDSGATVAPSSEPTASPVPLGTKVYRNVTTYEAINAPAKMIDKSPVYSTAGSKLKTISKKKISLAKNKSVKVTAEKNAFYKKWMKVSFTYKKKNYSGYVLANALKLTCKKAVYAKIANVKKSAKIYTKAGAKTQKVYDGKKVSVKLNAGVNIKADKLVKKKTKWYKISYTFNKKTLTGYIDSKYVKLAKKPTVKKIAVIALTEAEFEESMKVEGFPESYKASLRELHKKFPYWQFKAFKTGLDWNKSLTKECRLGSNLISNSKSKAWKSTEPDAYDSKTGKWKILDGTSWVAASKAAIAFYMDPRNFLNERTIFQFESLEYQQLYQTTDGINCIIKNTPFYNKSFSYKDISTGAKKSITFVNCFVEAAKQSGVSPYHLASRIKQEVVTSATTTSIAATGTNSTYPGIFNFYNIGATSGSNAALRGLKWASEGTTYLRPWNDRYRSIVGGAMFISTSYIKKGQNTGYLQKFNMTSYETYDHQYMQNVEAAYSEALKTKNAYADMMNNSPIVFSIPVYENMPKDKCQAPT